MLLWFWTETLAPAESLQNRDPSSPETTEAETEIKHSHVQNTWEFSLSWNGNGSKSFLLYCDVHPKRIIEKEKM